MSVRTFMKDPLISIANHKYLLILTYLLTIAVGATGFMLLEHHTLVESLYFAVVAGTSTGFGDLAPVTSAGMLFVVGYLLWAIPVLLSLVTAFVVSLLRVDPEAFTSAEQQEVLETCKRMNEYLDKQAKPVPYYEQMVKVRTKW